MYTYIVRDSSIDFGDNPAAEGVKWQDQETISVLLNPKKVWYFIIRINRKFGNRPTKYRSLYRTSHFKINVGSHKFQTPINIFPIQQH